MPSPSSQYTLEESIPLTPGEKSRLLSRKSWDTFLGSVPVPALWVSAHVDVSQARPAYAALNQLIEIDLKVSRSRDSIATAYRVFLQKLITQLNRKILRSRTSTNTFRFLGSLECSSVDVVGHPPHFHFFLWEPAGLFIQDPLALPTTASTLKSLWHQKVNNKESARCKPIDIQTIWTPEDAQRVAMYTNKSNRHFTSYELFDDWSSSIRATASAPD